MTPDRPECASCPFCASACGCRWGAQSHTTAPVSDCSGSVGTDTSHDLTGAQNGAQRIEERA